MPSFLIVHSQPPGGRADLFAQPPMIDVSGLGARLDWGDVTFEVPPGDLRVTISVDPVAGGHEGAVVTVRVLPETGTRISFAPPATPGAASVLRVDGQWPADAAMAYYATRDRRVLAPIAQQQVGGQQPAASWGAPPTSAPQPASSPRPPAQPAPSVPPVGPSIGSTGSVPIVAPASSAPTFGQVQGAVVVPGAQQHVQQTAQPIAHVPAWSSPPAVQQQAPAPRPVGHGVPPQHAQPQQWGQPQQAFAPHPQSQPFAPQAHGQHASQALPQHAQQLPGSSHAQHAQQVPPPFVPPQQQAAPVAPPAFGPGAQQHQQAMPLHPGQPAFGHQPAVRRDVYGRDRVDGDRSAPPIPTPREFEDFAKAERERHDAHAVAATRQQQGWYPDPYGRSDVRWHDGERWTSSVMRQGRREHDAI